MILLEEQAGIAGGISKFCGTLLGRIQDASPAENPARVPRFAVCHVSPASSVRKIAHG